MTEGHLAADTGSGHRSPHGASAGTTPLKKYACTSPKWSATATASRRNRSGTPSNSSSRAKSCVVHGPQFALDRHPVRPVEDQARVPAEAVEAVQRQRPGGAEELGAGEQMVTLSAGLERAVEEEDRLRHYFRPGGSQSSVRNGEAGSPALFARLASGKFFQPYRTATGFDTWSLTTATVSPSIVAVAG